MRGDDVAKEPLDDELLRRVLIHGPRQVKVELTDYDPTWPERYQQHARQIRDKLGSRARLIEHIGSTSVPGLAAKNVVDIVVGIDDPDDEDTYLPPLRELGYELRVREPRHRCLRAEEPDGPVNLHCYPPDAPEIKKYLLFRDRLLADETDRQLYEQTKRSLAERTWDDMNYYAEAKGSVIQQILQRAGWQEPRD
jgi:GrpB-like predicted nucleotidyltransferase (UPF0157 family)